MNQALAEFLCASVHGQLCTTVAPLDDDMAGPTFLSLEGAALSGQFAFQFLCVHIYSVLHSSVEVNINVEFNVYVKRAVRKDFLRGLRSLRERQYVKL